MKRQIQLRAFFVGAALALMVLAFAGAIHAASTNATKVIREATADYTILAADDEIEIHRGSAIILTLPAASTVATTHPITIRHLGAPRYAADMGTYRVPYQTKILPTGSDTIDGASTFWFGGEVVMYSDGISSWRSQPYQVGLGYAPSITGDLTVAAEQTGGNAGAKNELIGLPRIKMVGLGAGTNGTTETTSYMDDTPTGEWSEVDAGTAVTLTADATYYRVGTKSLKMAFLAAAVAGDGATATIAGDNLEANESIGFWIRSSQALTAGDLTLVLTDDGGARTFNVPAVATADKWTWVEVDISSLDAGTGDTITAVKFLLSAAGAALGALDIYIDDVWKWDATDEEALGAAIQQDGVLSVMSILTAGASDNTISVLTEGTNYFVHYESGNDFIVWVTDQSTKSQHALIAY